jgi:hypothetical protein
MFVFLVRIRIKRQQVQERIRRIFVEYVLQDNMRKDLGYILEVFARIVRLERFLLQEVMEVIVVEHVKQELLLQVVLVFRASQDFTLMLHQ